MDKTHYRKAFNSPYLSSADIVEPTDLTISHVRLEPDKTKIITYWEMCTSWNLPPVKWDIVEIITYWEMCTSWNLMVGFV